MHTIIRFTPLDDGFAVVISGRASDPIGAQVQQYETSQTHGDNYTTLVSTMNFTDERDAIHHFNWIYFNNRCLDGSEGPAIPLNGA